MASLTKDMTAAEFEAVVDSTFEIISSSGLPTPRENLRADLLGRFAELHKVSVEEAERILNTGTAAPAPEPEPEEPPAKRKQTVKEATRAMKAIAGSTKFFYESPKDAAFMDLFFALRRDAGLVANLLVTGPSGSGKTEGLMRAAERAGLPSYKVDCASITTSEKWLGHKEIDGTGTHFVLSEHLKWVEAKDVEPGLVIYDEINRLHPMLTSILFPILDGSQRIWVPELGTYIHVNEKTIFAATANIGVGFTGTHRMDDAFSGRFGYRLPRDFPEAEKEIEILVKRTGIDETKAKMLVEIATQTRLKARTGDLSMPVSTRNLLDTAALVAAGQTVAQAADYTFVQFYTEDGGASSERVFVKQAVQGKTAGR